MKFSPKIWTLLLVATGLLSACKDAVKDDKSDKPTPSDESPVIDAEEVAKDQPGFAAVDIPEINDVADRFFSVLGYSYERRIGELATTGEAQFSPYSGSWYPEQSGGTNVDGTLDKYDDAFSPADGSAASWEATIGNHTVTRESPTAGWEGHCNGFGAAAARHEEPPLAVTKNGETFTPADIKALLAEIYMNTDRFFLGGVRCERANPPLDPLNRPGDKTRMGECEDVNPAAMHLGLANVVGGKKKIPVVMDFELKEQVWNYPVCGFSCTNCGPSRGQYKEVTETQAMQIVTGSGGNYIFERGAEKYFDVQLDVYYAHASGAETTGNDCSDPRFRKTKSLRYILEVDGESEIIGGEWAQSSRSDHPDFIWFPLEAQQGKGDPTLSNPRINPKFVLDLWRESWRKAGHPKKYEGERTPTWRTNWGVRNGYTLTIDGAQSGAVFLGKRTRLQFEATGSRYDGDNVSLLVNGRDIKSFQASSGGKYQADFDARAGMNELRVVFSSGASESSERLRFYAIP